MSAQLLALFVAVLALVETPQGVPPRPGRAGETGHWQLTPAVRADRGRELRAAGLVVTDEALVRAQVRWLEREMARAGVDALPFNVALAWNCGLTRTLSGGAPLASYDFARRVTALLERTDKFLP